MYNFYCVLRGGKWVIYNANYLREFGGLPRFGLVAGNRTEAKMLVSNMTDEHKRRLANIAQVHRLPEIKVHVCKNCGLIQD